MNYSCFVLHPDADHDETWEQLSVLGYVLLYSLEEPGQPAKIYGHMPANALEPHASIAAVIPCSFDGIDWAQQWNASGGDTCDGNLLLDLEDYLPGCKKKLELTPGPGFGDLSHPTTVQTLRLMAPLLHGKFVLDVGCGSGILSFAAAQLGAAAVHGIDIDADALEHARSNALKNQGSIPLTFGLPKDHFKIPAKMQLLVAMNMITSEQHVAWASLANYHTYPADIITSGVLAEQRDEYLKHCKSLGWRLVQESESDGWLAFHFCSEKSC